MKKLSRILKDTREDLDLSQIEVMRITGINNKTLSGYENGVAEPDIETLIKLFRLYHLSSDKVFELGNYNTSDNAVTDKFLSSISKLNEEQIEALSKFIDLL